MKTTLLATLLMALAPTSALASDAAQILATVQHLQPANDLPEAYAIAKAVQTHADASGLDWKLIVAILAQESSLLRDPQRCYEGHRCTDLGIAQINWKTWAEPYALERDRILIDPDYAIGVMAKILTHYRDTYGAKERHWFSRYNSATASYRALYQEKVLAKYAKIKAYERELRSTEDKMLRDGVRKACKDSGPLFCALWSPLASAKSGAR